MSKCWSVGPNITITAKDYMQADLNPEEKQRIIEAGKNQWKFHPKKEEDG